jgi:putative membrane protein
MRVTRRLVSLLALATLVALPASLPALAQSGTAERVTHRQSVLTEMSPEGEAGTSRVFTQLTVVGDGEVELALPNQSTSGLRNLEGFGRPAVEGDQVVYSVAASRDGTAERTVADNTAELPIEISIAYELDGEPIEPKELVGKTGDLTATFTVRNTTAVPTEVRFFDGRQNPQRETIDVAVPMVGSLSMNLDGRFVDIDAPAASVAGDGRGNTTISWSMVLFEPVGSEEQIVSYTAHVTDAIVPEMIGQFLPVDSTSFSSLKSVQDTFGDVADGLSSLTTGALIVDGNVKLLADGAGQLLDGLGQLSDGADQLSAGLNERAAPGSRQLADGMGQARAGGRQLADGLLELDSGANRLSDGLGQARAGSGELAGGLNLLADGSGRLSSGSSRLAAGANQLNSSAGELADGAGQVGAGAAGLLNGLIQLREGLVGKEGLINSVRGGIAQISAGVALIAEGVGDPATPGTLVHGSAALRDGLRTAATGTAALNQLGAGLDASFGPDEDGLDAGERAQLASDGLDKVAAALGAITQSPGGPLLDYAAIKDDLVCVAAAPGGGCALTVTLHQLLVTGANLGTPAQVLPLIGSVQRVADGLQENADDLGVLPETCEAALSAIAEPDPDGLAVIRAIKCISAQVDTGIRTGTETTPSAVAGATAIADGAVAVADGLQQLDAGLKLFDKQVVAGGRELDAKLGTPQTDPLTTLLGAANAIADGAGKVASGSSRLQSEGTTPLASGANELAAGAGELASGAGRAASGAGDLRSGLVQLDDGGQQLAAGSRRAADGSNDLANGLVQLDDGANELASGLGDAADGSVQLADGLQSAEEGGEKIADGTQALTDRGMSQIIDGASEGAKTPALAVAHAKAADARGKAGEGLPYGTVAGAEASAVYKFEIAGYGGPDEGPSTPVRAAATIAAFGIAGALGLGLRRTLV